MKNLLPIAAISLLATAAGCSKVPSDIIQPHKMALLMADVHTGEAVVDGNYNTYYNDSLKQTLKQSIYLKHGVTSEQVDSSFAWYGRNITFYMDVYDETIEILERRLSETGSRIAADASLTIAGDSVDVWAGARFLSFGDRQPTDMITFSFPRDLNWRRGDSYTWRAKFFNHPGGSRWLMAIEYADGKVEYIREDLTGDGWKELKVITDSLSDATRIYGYLESSWRRGTDLRIDSIEMVRKRVDPNTYGQRYFLRNIRNFYPKIDVETHTDSIGD